MSEALRLASVRLLLVVAGLAALALTLSPVIGAPGTESALILGLVLPPFCGAAGARIALRAQGVSVGELLLRANAVAALAFSISLGALTLGMLWVPVCAPGEGLAFLALGPGISMLLSATLGLAVGAYVPRPRLATALAAALPLAIDLFEVWGFYATPAVFAYGHFVGYFPGTLYDPDVTIGSAYVSYRGLSVVWWGALASGLAVSWDPEVRRARLSRTRAPLAALFVALVTLGIALESEGHRLGHFSTPDTIAEALGGQIESARCLVVHPRELPRADAARLAEDCDFRVTRAEEVLGVTQRARVTAFFFRSAEEKRALMGAASTYVAKPWRDEVYLQIGEWPHPVLFHEVVHVVAGNVGVGPFRVAGAAGGILASPGIIEGVAVAVAWDEREGLTPHQWARAMLELELMPPLRSIEGLQFLLHSAGTAYTASGSFVRWMLDTGGAGSVRRLYLSGDFDAALGRPLEDAERDWHAYLRAEVDLPEEALALARLRFERPGIFGSICPHAIANLRNTLAQDLAAGDDASAVGRCREILSMDPGQAGTRAALAGALARLGRDEDSDAELSRLVGPPAAASPVLQLARQERADARWRRGESASARAVYEALLAEPMGEDAARQLEVRVLAIEAGGETERALRELLAPPRDVVNDAATAMAAIARLRAARDDGLAPYLSARQLAFRRRFDLALPEIVDARARGLSSERAAREARRMEAQIRFGAGELDAAARLWQEVLRDPASSEGARVTARDWLDRVRFARAR
ncbi:MAG: hypothetical protein KF729_35565 [Sandaracinaceae bacterium]|nr:hypothetical protein [Sandaracinaceae bacterium]